jgi:hypothetical protein
MAMMASAKLASDQWMEEGYQCQVQASLAESHCDHPNWPVMTGGDSVKLKYLPYSSEMGRDNEI